jgi:hypothetical protein
MTLSEMFKSMSQLQSGSSRAHSIKVYRIPHDNLGDVKVMSVDATNEMDVYRLAELIMTDRLYPKYRDYSVDCTSYDAGVFKIWIIKQERDDE